MRARDWIGVTGVILMTLSAGVLQLVGCGGEPDDTRLSGKAEDLWGVRVDFDTCTAGVTVISPFSPAT